MSADTTGFECISFGRNLAIVRPSLAAGLFALDLLDPAKFSARCSDGTPLGGGRGGAVTLALPESGDHVVIRPYHHGGLFRRILGRNYIGFGRVIRELKTHNAALSAGVPVPEPLAAVCYRGLLFSRLYLIVREIPNAISLEQWLREHPDASPSQKEPVLASVASAVGKLFAAGIVHPDLHAGNILIQNAAAAPAAFIIDFDRARPASSLPPRLRDLMLFRFNRALVKRRLAPPLTLRDRLRFCRRLGLASDPAAFRRFVTGCAAHLRRHRWRY